MYISTHRPRTPPLPFACLAPAKFFSFKVRSKAPSCRAAKKPSTCGGARVGGTGMGGCNGWLVFSWLTLGLGSKKCQTKMWQSSGWIEKPLNRNKRKCKMFPNNNHVFVFSHKWLWLFFSRARGYAGCGPCFHFTKVSICHMFLSHRQKQC